MTKPFPAPVVSVVGVAESLAGPTADEPGADVGAVEQDVIAAINSTTKARHRGGIAPKLAETPMSLPPVEKSLPA
ncbi:hypothetical protein ACX80V_07900 [Arthrobacter sp. MDT3-24]